MLDLCSVSVELTCWATLSPLSHISRSCSAHSLSPTPWDTQDFDCHLLPDRGRSRIVGDERVPCSVFLDYPIINPCSCPKAPTQVLCQRIKACTVLPDQKDFQRGMWENPAHSAGVVSAFLFPESAKPSRGCQVGNLGNPKLALRTPLP